MANTKPVFIAARRPAEETASQIPVVKQGDFYSLFLWERRTEDTTERSSFVLKPPMAMYEPSTCLLPEVLTLLTHQ